MYNYCDFLRKYMNIHLGLRWKWGQCDGVRDSDGQNRVRMGTKLYGWVRDGDKTVYCVTFSTIHLLARAKCRPSANIPQCILQNFKQYVVKRLRNVRKSCRQISTNPNLRRFPVLLGAQFPLRTIRCLITNLPNWITIM